MPLLLIGAGLTHGANGLPVRLEQQEQQQRALELAIERPQPREALAVGELVGPVFGQARPSLYGAQPLRAQPHGVYKDIDLALFAAHNLHLTNAIGALQPPPHPRQVRHQQIGGRQILMRGIGPRRDDAGQPRALRRAQPVQRILEGDRIRRRQPQPTQRQRGAEWHGPRR